jgi:hypothetical protein
MSSGLLTNPALADLDVLVGDWDVEISKASFLPDPDEVVDAGGVSFRPIEGGSFLVQRHAEGVGPPAATWVIGRDGSRSLYTVLYADGRGVSRVYEMSFSGNTWKLWRDDPEFSQRFEATVSEDRNTIAGRWEKRFARADWEHDFNLRYTRR